MPDHPEANRVRGLVPLNGRWVTEEASFTARPGNDERLRARWQGRLDPGRLTKTGRPMLSSVSTQLLAR